MPFLREAEGGALSLSDCDSPILVLQDMNNGKCGLQAAVTGRLQHLFFVVESRLGPLDVFCMTHQVRHHMTRE